MAQNAPYAYQLLEDAMYLGVVRLWHAQGEALARC